MTRGGAALYAAAGLLLVSCSSPEPIRPFVPVQDPASSAAPEPSYRPLDNPLAHDVPLGPSAETSAAPVPKEPATTPVEPAPVVVPAEEPPEEPAP